MKKKTAFLIDGNAALYRAYYAIKGMSNSHGRPTGALFGFTALIIKIIKEYNPDYIAVAYDVKGKTFRHDKFEKYKATRKPMPDDLILQFPISKDILRALNIEYFEKQGYEADDLLATLSEKFDKKNIETFIVTGDKDIFQIVNDNIKIIRMDKDQTVFDKAKVTEEYGFSPELIPDLFGLTGDSSDNIPGVYGIGDRTARNLLKEFGSLDNILANIKNIKNAKVKNKLTGNEQQALLSRELAILDKNVELKDIECAKKNEINKQKVIELFDELNFYKFKKDLGLIQTAVNPKKIEYKKISAVDFAKIINPLSEVYFLEYSDLFQNTELYLKIKDIDIIYNLVDTKENILDYFFKKEFIKIGVNLKDFYKRFAYIDYNQTDFDIILAYYLIDPGKANYSIQDICGRCLNEAWVLGDGKEDFASNLFCMEKLKAYLEQELARLGMTNLFYNIEMPLLKVLVDLEKQGIRLDAEVLKNQSIELENKLKNLEDIIFNQAGEPFNINSPKQLGAILFDKMGLPALKKTKTGYSTDVKVLEQLAENYPIANSILEYRTLAKLKNTYLDALPKLVDKKTGRLHTYFNQMGTATGRLSSSEPNLQNIPIRVEEGKKIRKAFIPDNGARFLSADYSQVELRILAHFSEEPKMLDAFCNNRDIHTKTATEIFHLQEQYITLAMRRTAKIVNFGIIYGISAYGLAQDLGITQTDAKNYIESYFTEFNFVRKYLDKILEQAREKLFVQTLFNRVRFLPEITSQDRGVREFGERIAVNTIMQGTAADIIKIAMINMQKFLKEKKLKSKMLLQIHDELLFEVYDDEFDLVKQNIIDIMENVVQLKAPLKVDIESGYDWYEAK